MTSRASHHSTVDEQGASSENGAPRAGGARRKRLSKSLLARLSLRAIETYVPVDLLSDAERDESAEEAAARSKEEERRAADRECQAAMRAEQKAKGNTQYNIVPIPTKSPRDSDLMPPGIPT